MKKGILFLMAALLLVLTVGCGPGERYVNSNTRLLMESSDAPWNERVEKDCGIKDFGKPYGTTKETFDYDRKKNIWRITFELDETVTQPLVDGYAQSVWEACIEVDGGKLHSCSGYHYDALWEARRHQEPLNYYIWYYDHDAEDKEFRVGLYPSELEEGRPGALILEIQQWEQK
ncbi:hypothetical protein ACPW7J_00960 [Ihubacter sp. rT4E-8]|uniref:hypothetical protein n=1 Tax=unclassified Ihubacter TaxID=2633299 RepID=UPI00137A38A4